MMDTKRRIGFIGAGNMAQAVGLSIIRKGLVLPKDVFVSAPSERNFGIWKEQGVNLTHDNYNVVSNCDVIFLAMKPQYLDQFLKELSTRPNEWTSKSKLIVSIIGCLTCKTLHEKLKPVFRSNYHLVRTNPNTSLIVGEGFTAIYPDISTPEDDVELVKLLMSAGGTYEVVPESLMNAIGTLSGCGVAFTYQIIEALSDGAVKQGVPRAMSYRIAAQTLRGASEMVLKTNEHPAALKDNVCSPGGTTICGIHALESGGLRASLINAIEAAVVRSEELNEKLAKSMS